MELNIVTIAKPFPDGGFETGRLIPSAELQETRIHDAIFRLRRSLNEPTRKFDASMGRSALQNLSRLSRSLIITALSGLVGSSTIAGMGFGPIRHSDGLPPPTNCRDDRCDLHVQEAEHSRVEHSDNWVNEMDPFDWRAHESGEESDNLSDSDEETDEDYLDDMGCSDPPSEPRSLSGKVSSLLPSLPSLRLTGLFEVLFGNSRNLLWKQINNSSDSVWTKGRHENEQFRSRSIDRDSFNDKKFHRNVKVRIVASFILESQFVHLAQLFLKPRRRQ
ncbi:unnamed protein product [Protopolystoma xenopodis]|uniref:Uncharacterized protein n=1 Tax=Protopolystoma xenopodis TaxID=117903 RepID=A0A3S5AQ49_9PLAT|nr:unnamed protein product [Protopolystoma xenopodis]